MSDPSRMLLEATLRQLPSGTKEMNPSVDQEIARILVERFHVDADRIRPDSALDDLGLDSIALMEFVFEVEDALNLRIPEDRLDPRQSGITLGGLGRVLGDYMAELQAARDRS